MDFIKATCERARPKIWLLAIPLVMSGCRMWLLKSLDFDNPGSIQLGITEALVECLDEEKIEQLPENIETLTLNAINVPEHNYWHNENSISAVDYLAWQRGGDTLLTDREIRCIQNNACRDHNDLRADKETEFEMLTSQMTVTRDAERIYFKFPDPGWVLIQ